MSSMAEESKIKKTGTCIFSVLSAPRRLAGNSARLLQLLVVTSIPLGIAPGLAQANPLGQFDGNADIGAPALPGSAAYDAAQQIYTMTAAGTDMWFGRDQLHFVWKTMKGNFILRTKAEFIGAGLERHRKQGWMARTSLEANSPYVDCAERGDGLTSLQFRAATGANTEQIILPVTNANVLQFERKGIRFIFSAARFGEPFVSCELTNLDLSDGLYIGLFLCSHNGEVAERALFRDTRIICPVKEGFKPYRDYIGSVLEILEVHTGKLNLSTVPRNHSKHLTGRETEKL